MVVSVCPLSALHMLQYNYNKTYITICNNKMKNTGIGQTEGRNGERRYGNGI